MTTSTPRDATTEAHRLVARFLHHQSYSNTLAAFLDEASTKHPNLSLRSIATSSTDDSTDWNDLVESWIARDVSERKANDPDSSLADRLDHVHLPEDVVVPSKVRTVIKEASNVLTVKSGTYVRKEWDSTALRFTTSTSRCIMTTAVDKTLKLWSYPTSSSSSSRPLQLVDSHAFPSPVLSFVQHPATERKRYVACATMDGSLSIVDLVSRDEVVKVKDHNKYIVKVDWSPCGNYLATLGYDKLIHIYAVSITSTTMNDEDDNDDDVAEVERQGDDPTVTVEKAFAVHPRTNPEAAVFLPDSSALVFTCRDDHLIHYLSLPVVSAPVPSPSSPVDPRRDRSRSQAEPGGQANQVRRQPWTLTEFNLNPNLDSFTSFSILSISVHPRVDVLALQTSTASPRILLYPFWSSTRLRTLHTFASQSDYFGPRHVWVPSLEKTGRNARDRRRGVSPRDDDDDAHGRGQGGEAVVVNSEDGIVRVVDLQGTIRLEKGAHGMAAPSADDEFDERDGATMGEGRGEGDGQEELRSERARLRRQRDKGSSVVRDVEVVTFDDDDDGHGEELETSQGRRARWGILSAGFDKTVRLIV
ncbi:hypothetical protein JCM10212_006859 [Sporobolomyces blumeae]